MTMGPGEVVQLRTPQAFFIDALPLPAARDMQAVGEEFPVGVELLYDDDPTDAERIARFLNERTARVIDSQYIINPYTGAEINRDAQKRSPLEEPKPHVGVTAVPNEDGYSGAYDAFLAALAIVWDGESPQQKKVIEHEQTQPGVIKRALGKLGLSE